VAKYAADREYSFGIVSNAVATYSSRYLSVPLGASASQLALVLEALAMAGPYTVTSLTDVLKGERDRLPPGTTVVLVTTIVTGTLARETERLKEQGYRVMVLYAGDGDPGFTLQDVPIVHVGSAVDDLEEHEPVLAE